jgi:light-regulated signal transduction histidine kinase (bacteriophytochrome)
MERSDREMGEFLLRACHDLRSAARGVRTHAELLLKDTAATPGTPAFTERLGFVVQGARKTDAVVDGMVAYAVALQTHAESFQSTRMDVLLRGVLARLNKELLAADAEVVYGKLPTVTGDPDRLMQVWESLLRNALVHRGRAAPHIEINASPHEDDWLLSVRDNGPGVEAALLERIFVPFERLDSGPRQGAGLGLAICRAIIERHGGHIWAESQPEGGATFYFTLPAG